jgi:flagellar capping protein FliD
VFTSLTNKLFGHLGLEILRGLTRTTREKMQGSNFTMGLSGSMHGYFATLRNNLAEASKEVAEIMMMMEAIYKKFRIEHGLKLGTPTAFSLLRYEKELARLERWCNVNLNTPMHLLTLEKRVVTQRFFEEVAVQIRKTFEHANRDAEIWLKAIMAPMEAQVREHQMQLKRRLESIKRIHQATDTLEDRIAELNHSQNSLDSQIASMQQVAEQVEDRLKAAGFVQERRRLAAA